MCVLASVWLLGGCQANEAIIRQYDPSVSITTTLRQLPVTKHMYKQAGGFDSFYVCIMILLAMPFISSSFMLFIVREREQKAKHLQVSTQTHN